MDIIVLFFHTKDIIYKFKNFLYISYGTQLTIKYIIQYDNYLIIMVRSKSSIPSMKQT
jgi:hypothetical protein